MAYLACCSLHINDYSFSSKAFRFCGSCTQSPVKHSGIHVETITINFVVIEQPTIIAMHSNIQNIAYKVIIVTDKDSLAEPVMYWEDEEHSRSRQVF